MEEKVKKSLYDWQIAVILLLLTLVSIIVLMNLTNPTEIGPNGILLLFSLFYVFFLAIFFLLIKVLYIAKIVKFGLRKALFLSSVMAFAPVLSAALFTLGQFSSLDLILLALLEVMVCFYIIKKL